MSILTDKLVTLKSTASSLENILEQERKTSKAKLEKLTTKLADAKAKLAEATAKESEYRQIIQVFAVWYFVVKKDFATIIGQYL